MRILPAGARALLLELDDGEQTQSAYLRILELVETGDLPAPVDLVPAARTVLIDGITSGEWRRVLAGLDLQRTADKAADAERGEIVVPVRYDGADLAEVAAAWECDEASVVERHQETRFTVAFCGFAPGFAYCSSRGALPSVPRRERPRTRVPAGAVGLAGEYCGIYPRDMPGGWQLVGSTDLVLFDDTREPPALLQPGDRVRFEAAS